MPRFDKIHNRFKLNGCYYNSEGLKEVAYSFVKEGEPYERDTGIFLLEWLSADDFLYVKTSGSTGHPKSIKLQKQAMVNSAIATGNFFKLEPGNKALGCLPNHYIAGKMMLVRAMILGLEIDCVEPKTQPIFDCNIHYDFCAMVPIQLKCTIKNVNNIKTIIIGGSKITQALIQKIANFPNRIFETYGMTETSTHIAVKQLQSKFYNSDNEFNALPEVSFSQDKRNCLKIRAPHLVDEELVTNDIVNLTSSTSFKWLGRYDNVVNSGGVKLFPEQIEDKLQAVINERFLVASKPDDDLGNKLILIIENPKKSLELYKKELSLVKELDKFELPKEIYKADKFAETESGKIHRKKTIQSILG